MFGLSTLELKLAGIAVVLLAVSGFLTYERFHLINEGKQRVEMADKTARAEEIAKNKVVTATLYNQASQAKGERDAAQKALNDYMSAHPLGVVSVCRRSAGDSGRGLSEGSGTGLGTVGTGAGPGSGGSVSGGGDQQGVDIAPELGTVVRSFGELAILYRESQVDYAHAQAGVNNAK